MQYIIKAIIPIIIFFIIFYGMCRGVKVYECFIEGAKQGMKICFRIFPYLLAMIVAVNVFRESKALAYLINLVSPIIKTIGIPGELVPLIFIKPLSGSGALGVFADILKQFGPDSYIGKMASILMGSTETIFYTITVYFGSVGIKKVRHTIWAAVLADLVAIIMTVFITNLMLV